ncbi:MAG: copper chaperone PCu(A)C [Hyphomonadaceae bacterium]
MRAFFSFAVLLLAACGAATEAPAQTHTLEVRQAWATPTPGGVDVSGGYLVIDNNTSSADRLVSASSSRAARVEIHEMSMDGGVMRMRRIDGGLAAPANTEVALAPGGLHLMFMGVTQPFQIGEQIPLQLTFEHAGRIDVTLTVQRGPPTAEHQHHDH